MAEAWTTHDVIRSKTYDDYSTTDAVYDTAIDTLIQEVTAQMISYLDGAEIDVDDPPQDLERACALQVFYEWKRRKDVGLISRTFPDGSVNKESLAEFIPAVKTILERYRRYTI